MFFTTGAPFFYFNFKNGVILPFIRLRWQKFDELIEWLSFREFDIPTVERKVVHLSQELVQPI